MAPGPERSRSPPDNADRVDLGGIGVTGRSRARSGRPLLCRSSPARPRALAAPLHRHHREDEYSYVISGTLGALLGDEVVTAGPGTWVFKPRDQWHTFWNAGDTPCEIVEIISPAGFENCFRELASCSDLPRRTRVLFSSSAPVRARHGSGQRPRALRALRAHPPACVAPSAHDRAAASRSGGVGWEKSAR